MDKLYLGRNVSKVGQRLEGQSPETKSIKVVRKTSSFDVSGILRDELKFNPLNAVGFIRFRNFGMTELELDEVLSIFAVRE